LTPPTRTSPHKHKTLCELVEDDDSFTYLGAVANGTMIGVPTVATTDETMDLGVNHQSSSDVNYVASDVDDTDDDDLDKVVPVDNDGDPDDDDDDTNTRDDETKNTNEKKEKKR
jgi:hypothetical protein